MEILDESSLLVGSLSYLALGVVLVSSIYYCFFSSDSNQKQFDDLTKLKKAPGSMFYCLDRLRSNKSHLYHLELHRSLGNFVYIQFGSRKCVFVYDHKVARQILDDPRHQKWKVAYSFIDDVVGGENFFSSEGFRSKHTRKSTNPAFHPQNVQHMMDVVDGILDEWLQDQDKNGTFVVDATNEMQRLTIEVIGQIGFDYKISRAERDLILKNLQITYEEYSVNVRRNPLRKFFPFFFERARQARVASRELQKLGRHIFDTKSKSIASSSNSSVKTILEHLIEDKDYVSDEERVRDMVVYVAGGYEATGATISWTLLELARNPSVQSWLRQELLKVKDPKERRYCLALKHVIRESMRLNLVAAVTAVRTVEQDIPLPDIGGYIPAKAIVAIPCYPMHRDASIFENPDSFQPKRWESPTTEMNQAWIGFGSGRRNCQGQALANAELSVVLAKLCSEYEWTVEKEGEAEYYVTLKTVGTLLRARKVA